MRRPRAEPGAAAAADERTVRTAAYALLAGRDFSRHELATRLLRKGYPRDHVNAAVEAVVQEGLLREERFAEQFVHQLARRGRGPLRVRLGLREKGVDAETVERAFDASPTDWVQAAREARRRKFGAELPAGPRERAKQARFLQYRGFSSDQIRAALGPGEDDPD